MKLLKEINSKAGRYGWKVKWGIFKCARCGDEVEREFGNGKRDKTCGCKQRERKHGMTYTRIYRTWRSMKDRCTNSNYMEFYLYGGRGITICGDWLDFKKFHKWASSNGYKGNLQIDRIDNEKGYTPDNCRFVPPKENARNRRCVILSLKRANDIRHIYSEGFLSHRMIAEIYGVSKSTVSHILNNRLWN